MARRRTDLDSLRIVLCAAVILQHAVLVFAEEPRYHVKAEESAGWATVLYEALRIFAMPPFFALAGWAAVTSLRRRSPAVFLRERALRLLPPIFLAMAIFGPVIKYIELRGGRNLGSTGYWLREPLETSFFEFVPLYFSRSALVTWSHGWFLVYLAIYTVAALPVLAALAAAPMRQSVPHPVLVFLPAPILAAVLALFGGYWPYLPNLVQDWTNFAYFGLCFLAGAIIAWWPMLERALEKSAGTLLLMGCLGLLGVLAYGESTAGRVGVGFAAWGLLGAAWGGVRLWNPAPTPTLSGWTEATFPIYLVHHLPLLLIALLVLPLPLPLALQMLLIAGLSLLVSSLLYVCLIRPFAPMRFLFGMGRQKGL